MKEVQIDNHSYHITSANCRTAARKKQADYYSSLRCRFYLAAVKLRLKNALNCKIT